MFNAEQYSPCPHYPLDHKHSLFPNFAFEQKLFRIEIELLSFTTIWAIEEILKFSNETFRKSN